MLRAIYNKIISRPKAGAVDVLESGTELMPIEYRKRPNARRYILRVNATGNGGCVTIPRGGSLAEARSFAKRNASWLEKRLLMRREAERTVVDDGRVWFRGERVPVVMLDKLDEPNPLTPSLWLPKPATSQLPEKSNALRATWSPIGGEGAGRADEEASISEVKARVKLKLWQLAWKELPARVGELAAQQGLTVRRVSVRDQRSRWGSCSARGVVSLNWRLVQTPEFVRDYIIVHELMHLRQMNHSNHFWKLVYAAYPRTDEAEKWLKQHAGLLRER